MKNFIFALIIVTVGLLLQGCLPMVSSPAYTHNDIVYDPNLLGRWGGNVGSTGDIAAQFKPGPVPNMYQLNLSWQKKQGTARAVLFKLGGHRFLDIAPADSNDVFTDLVFTPAHLVVRIDSTSPQLQFATMSEFELENIIAADPGAVENRITGAKTLLTCSTRDTQKFILRHVNDVFGQPMILKRAK